ncbi:ATP-binding protein [Clostridium sp. JNZ X4-2]
MYYNISVIDNGSGFDTGQIKDNSLGLNIVKSIIKDKLKGDINIESNKSGTKAVFSFKN